MVIAKKEKKIGVLLVCCIFLIIAVSLTIGLAFRYHTQKNWSYDSKTTATLIGSERIHLRNDPDYYEHTYLYTVNNEFFTITTTDISKPKYGENQTILYDSSNPKASLFSTGFDDFKKGTEIYLYITIGAYGIFLLTLILSFFYIQSLQNDL